MLNIFTCIIIHRWGIPSCETLHTTKLGLKLARSCNASFVKWGNYQNFRLTNQIYLPGIKFSSFS